MSLAADCRILFLMKDTDSLANHFLIAMPKLADANFARSVTLICEHSEEGAMGVVINRLTGEISYGRIPKGSVVVSGNLPSSDGKYSLYGAVIVKQVDEKTRSKVGINELLRDI